MNHTVNAYDFDHTIYDGDASLQFIIFCLKSNPKTWKYLFSYAIVLTLFVLKLKSRKEVKETAFAFLKEIDDIDMVVSQFWRDHKSNIKKWYLDQLQKNDVVLSASPEFLLTPVFKELGVASIIATRMNKNTGKITGQNCRGEEKLIRLKEYDPALEIDSFYSDSMADLPLFKIAKKPYIVKKHTFTLISPNKNTHKLK